MKNVIVPDANVFIKLLNPEHDSNQALQFFRDCAIYDSTLVVPELFVYETIEITRKFNEGFEKTLRLIESYKNTLLEIISPDPDTWQTAEKITQHGHPKSGYPSVYDAIYHAIAIENKGIFVTADKRHYDKSQHFGHIVLLSDWKNVTNKLR
ncbi:MAG: hypothetical protein CR974_02385 [Gammaproteobacteria bacterium]|nr:MAG: hypothetical protein CR974_02385 [Gammaproteobacteria bacterium]